MSHAVLWENGTAFDLGVLPGDEDSGAAAINELGVIVGSSGRTDPETYEQTYRPFIYQNGVMTPIQMPSSEALPATSTMTASSSAPCAQVEASPTGTLLSTSTA